MMAETRSSGWDVGRVLGFIERLFRWGDVLFGDNIVDRLLHLSLLFFIIEFITSFDSAANVKDGNKVQYNRKNKRIKNNIN